MRSLNYKIGRHPVDYFELRPPNVVEFNERPQHEYRVIDQPSMMPVSLHGENRYNLSMVMPTENLCFETIVVKFYRWVEDYDDEGTSFGRMSIFVNYVSVPRDHDITNMFGYDESDSMDMRNAESFYRSHIHHLEQEIRELKENRLILPQEAIDNIHSGVHQLNDKPIKQQYFDDEIFEME